MTHCERREAVWMGPRYVAIVDVVAATDVAITCLLVHHLLRLGSEFVLLFLHLRGDDDLGPISRLQPLPDRRVSFKLVLRDQRMASRRCRWGKDSQRDRFRAGWEY